MNSDVNDSNTSTAGAATLLATRLKSTATSQKDRAQQAEKLQDGIASLALNLIETIIEILERQAFRRFSSGTLTDREIERLGISFSQMRNQLLEVAAKFNYQPKTLKLALTSKNDLLGSGGAADELESKSLSIADLVDKLIDNQVVIAGDVRIAVAGIDLVTLNLLASIKSSVQDSEGLTGLRESRNSLAEMEGL